MATFRKALHVAGVNTSDIETNFLLEFESLDGDQVQGLSSAETISTHGSIENMNKLVDTTTRSALLESETEQMHTPIAAASSCWDSSQFFICVDLQDLLLGARFEM